MIGSVSAQQLMDVTDTAFSSNTPTPTFGNPIWGDIDNDGYLDLIMPTLKQRAALRSAPHVLYFETMATAHSLTSPLLRVLSPRHGATFSGVASRLGIMMETATSISISR